MMFWLQHFSFPKKAEEKKQNKWEDLPLEIKEMIIQRSTEGTRNALGACSTADKKLVEETTINSITKMEVLYGYGEVWGVWLIIVYTAEMVLCAAPEAIHKLHSFEEFQNKILDILKHAHCLKELCVQNLKDSTSLKLIPPNSQSRLLVESVVLNTKNSNQLENILSQIEPGYLRNITMKDEGNSKVYDMQQVILAEILRVKSLSSIRVDQILKLKARKVVFGSVTISMKKFAEKFAVQKYDNDEVRFIFGGSHAYDQVAEMCKNSSTVAFPTCHDYLKFEFFHEMYGERHHVSGDFVYIYESTTHNWNKLIELAFVYKLEKKLYCIYVDTKTHEYVYSYKTLVDAQRRLEEFFSYTTYIGKLVVALKSSNEPMVWPAMNKELIITRLDVRGNHSITNIRQLLAQINHFFVKSVRISSNEVDDDLFNFEHISNASEVRIQGSVLHADQLLRIKAQFLESLDGNQNKSLTANDFNQYIKHCLFDSNDRSHYFYFTELSEELSFDEIFRDCIVLKGNQLNGWRIITVPGSEYMLHAVRDRHLLIGIRQKRTDSFPSIWHSREHVPWHLPMP